jgi:hypothetical protein
VLGSGCFALLLSTSGAFAFSASFAWRSGSPSFTLTDVPQGTERLQFAMTDLNVPSFHHGGGTVAYSGQAAVPCGAFSSGFTARRRGQVRSTLVSSLSSSWAERRSAGNDHDAAQVSGMTIA